MYRNFFEDVCCWEFREEILPAALLWGGVAILNSIAAAKARLETISSSTLDIAIVSVGPPERMG